MDKTKFAMLNGHKGRMALVIPIHGIITTSHMLSAYTEDGGQVSYSYDKIVDNAIDVLPDDNVKSESLWKDSLKVDKKMLERLKAYARLNKQEIESVIRERAASNNNVRAYNVGNSDYSKHSIQPWDVWKEYHLNPWDADIVKRILRVKTEEGMTPEQSRKLDYEKIIHICKERIAQIDAGYVF